MPTAMIRLNYEYQDNFYHIIGRDSGSFL
jgi:hypothetical protein